MSSAPASPACSAATKLCASVGLSAVTLHEAAPQAGGRCRSYVDQTLGTTIDNGNHLVLSGNAAALAYLAPHRRHATSSPGRRKPPSTSLDIRDGLTGRIRRTAPAALPWWILDPSRRVPGTRLARLSRRCCACAPLRPDARIGEVIACNGPLYERLLASPAAGGPQHRACHRRAPGSPTR